MSDVQWVKIFNDNSEAERKVPRGTQKKILINNIGICLAHTQEGYFAIQNDCPHQRAPLYKGNVNNSNEIVCPQHSYRFDLATGSSRQSGCGDAKIYPIKSGENGFFLGFY